MCGAPIPQLNMRHRLRTEQMVYRAKVTKRIRKLLAEKQQTVLGMARELSTPWNTVYNYLRCMERAGEAHRTGVFDDQRRELWAAGRGQQAQPVEQKEVEQQQAKIVEARQIGMHRDSLVAALFGPARGAAA